MREDAREHSAVQSFDQVFGRAEVLRLIGKLVAILVGLVVIFPGLFPFASSTSLRRFERDRLPPRMKCITF